MKKALSLFLTAFMLLATFSACTVKRSVPGTQDFFIVNPLDRITPTTEVKSLNSDALEITLAKNEKEGSQFVLRSETRQYNNIQVSASELKTEDGINTISAADVELFHLEYARQKDLRTSANLMMPLSDPDFNNLTSVIGENLVYYVRVTTKTETPAGTYLGEVTVTHDGGEVKIPLKVTVIDFTLPQRPSLKTDMLYWQSFTERFYGNRITKAQAYEFFAEAVKVCRENKITVRTYYDEPQFGRYGTGHEKEYAAAIKKFLTDNPTVTIFNIPVIWTEWMKTINTEKTLPIINALRDEGVLDMGLMCTIDEPHTPEEYMALREIGEWVLKYAPDVNHYVTTFPTHIDMNIVNPEHIKVWCSVYPLMDIGTLKYYQQTYGSKFWGYGFDKGSNIDLNNIRTIGWELKKFDMIGLEDWCINSYTHFYSPETDWVLTLDDAYLFAWFFPGREGDGVVNKNKQIVTLTLENIRDTIEDYEYLIALETRVQEKLDALGLDITRDQAMESYYDALFLDVHKLPNGNYKNFTQTRDLMINEILNGTDYILTTKQDPIQWVNDNRFITIYTEPDKVVTINGVTPEKQTFETYATHTYYMEMDEKGVDLKISVDGKESIRHLLCKDYSKAKIIDLANPQTLTALREANPNADIDIINVDGLDTLKLTFTEKTKRGINIPKSVMDSPFGDYKEVRFNAWTEEAYDNIIPTLQIKTETTILTSGTINQKPMTTDKTSIYTLGWADKALTDTAALLKNLIIGLDKTLKEGDKYTVYINNLYFIDESNHFEWIIF